MEKIAYNDVIDLSHDVITFGAKFLKNFGGNLRAKNRFLAHLVFEIDREVGCKHALSCKIGCSYSPCKIGLTAPAKICASLSAAF